MKRRLLVILGFSLVAGATAQDTPSTAPPPPPEQEQLAIPDNWPGIEYAEVRAYLYNPDQNRENLIIEKGKLHPQVLNPDGVKLDATQIERLLTILRHKSPYEGAAACLFLPHHGIVFYDREGKPVAQASICFLCEVMIAAPATHPMSESDFAALKRLVQDLGFPVFEDATEADVHFAKQWSDTKLKAAIEEYLFDESELAYVDDQSRSKQLEGLGTRTHPLLLSHLAAEKSRSVWLESPPGNNRSGNPFSRLCQVFGDTPPAAAIPWLAPFLDEAEASVRCDAAATMAKTGAPEIVPFVRRALKDSGRSKAHAAEDLEESISGRTVSACTLAGLQLAMDRGVLDASVRAQLFPDVKGAHDGISDEHWAKALISLDSNKAMEVFLNDEVFRANSPKLGPILGAAVESNLLMPRERLLKLVAELRSTRLDPEQEQSQLKHALVLLGQHRHPDDLELFKGMSDIDLANFAMPGLLAWHGLHGYRDRLSKQVEEKGFDSLDKTQRLHFAAREFEFTNMGKFYLWDKQGGHWRDALAGLKAMKRDQLAAVLEEAVAKFGPDGPSADLETRKAQFETLKKKGAFEDFEDRMPDAVDPTDLSLDRFAIEHAESFK